MNTHPEETPLPAAGDVRGQLVPLPPSPSGAQPGRFVVPSRGDLEAALAKASTVEELIDFDSMMSLLDEAARRFGIAIDEAIGIATCHLQGKRRLGLALMHHVKHGGDRTRSQHANLIDEELLRRIDKDRRSRYKALARVPQVTFEGYLKTKADRREIPKEAGALRFATKEQGDRAPRHRRRRNLGQGRGDVPVLTAAMLDVVVRVLGEIDVCIGEADVPCRCRMQPSTVNAQRLRGNILVAECLSPDEWIQKFSRLHGSAAVGEVVVALPVMPAARWFRDLFDSGWACCFTATTPPALLAHLGHHHAFAIACSEIGVVLRKWMQ